MDTVAYPPQANTRALAIAHERAHELLNSGAMAAVLVGSHARGDAGPHSDIDLHALGVGPHYTLIRRGPFLISESWRTPEAYRASFLDIQEVGAAVPGWR